mmetsp:Transcript_13937/g.33787  ORF Transcript_13937/g.33787 Transcript_13937/m.33787 type:complete len:83 (+) Transcript_13937:904-1152(+)
MVVYSNFEIVDAILEDGNGSKARGDTIKGVEYTAFICMYVNWSLPSPPNAESERWACRNLFKTLLFNATMKWYFAHAYNTSM